MALRTNEDFAEGELRAGQPRGPKARRCITVMACPNFRLASAQQIVMNLVDLI